MLVYCVLRTLHTHIFASPHMHTQHAPHTRSHATYTHVRTYVHSYSFSEHLKHCLTDHVMKVHNTHTQPTMHMHLQVDVHQSCLQLNDGRLLYGSRKEYQHVLCDLKVLARLLGLLMCLPYKMASSACHTSAPLYGPYSNKVRGHVTL